MLVGGEDQFICNPPYIHVGSDCCLDQNTNRICDYDEKPTTTTLEETTSTNPSDTTLTVSTTSPPTTLSPSTIILATSTSLVTETTLSSFYQCVADVGYPPDNFVYVYSQGCGDQFVSTAQQASNEKDVGLIKITLDTIDSKEKAALECFLGKYTSSTEANFYLCPRLMCPKTGVIENVDGRKPVRIQMRGFADKCK